VVAGDITTQPKQGRKAMPMSSLSILCCLWCGGYQQTTFAISYYCSLCDNEADSLSDVKTSMLSFVSLQRVMNQGYENSGFS
jgi:hypothetical protein